MTRSILYASLVCIVMTLGMVFFDLYSKKMEPFNSVQVQPNEITPPAADSVPAQQKAPKSNSEVKQVATRTEPLPVKKQQLAQQTEPADNERAQMTVTALVRGLRNLKGQVIAQIFDKADAFNSNRYDRALSTIMVNARDFKGELHFRDLPPGKYAIALFHDENGNQQFDQKSTAIEGYAYSNNTGKNTPAKFKQAAFSAEKDKKLIIRLIYH